MKSSHNISGHVNDLNLSTRPANCLKNMQIRTIAALVSHSEEDLRLEPNMGRRSIDEIKKALKRRGLELGQIRAPPSKPKRQYWNIRPVLVNGEPRWCLERVTENENSEPYISVVYGDFKSQAQAKAAISHLGRAPRIY